MVWHLDLDGSPGAPCPRWKPGYVETRTLVQKHPYITTAHTVSNPNPKFPHATPTTLQRPFPIQVERWLCRDPGRGLEDSPKRYILNVKMKHQPGRDSDARSDFIWVVLAQDRPSSSDCCLLSQ